MTTRLTPPQRRERLVIAADPYQEIATPGEARGLALSDGDDIWVGNPNGVVHYDLVSGREIGRFGCQTCSR